MARIFGLTLSCVRLTCEWAARLYPQPCESYTSINSSILSNGGPLLESKSTTEMLYCKVSMGLLYLKIPWRHLCILNRFLLRRSKVMDIYRPFHLWTHFISQLYNFWANETNKWINSFVSVIFPHCSAQTSPSATKLMASSVSPPLPLHLTIPDYSFFFAVGHREPSSATFSRR